jgi:hypothetical protein
MKDERQKPLDIRERSLEYALLTIKLFQVLKHRKHEAGYIIGKQYLVVHRICSEVLVCN